jgi:hypothetical protein
LGNLIYRLNLVGFCDQKYVYKSNLIVTTLLELSDLTAESDNPLFFNYLATTGICAICIDENDLKSIVIPIKRAENDFYLLLANCIDRESLNS